MLLSKIKDGVNGVKASQNNGLEDMCNTFLNAVLPDADTSATCSFVGGIDMRLRGLMDSLFLDDWAKVIETLRL